MNLLEHMEQRQSCRSYDNRPVEEEKLAYVLQTAALSPSARNGQPWQVAVCTGETKQKVAKACQMNDRNGFFTDAPVAVVISQTGGEFVKATDSVGKSYDRRPIDIGLYAHAFILACAEVGLGSCMIAWLDEKAIQNALGTSDEVELVIAVGYPKQDDPLRPKTRKPLQETVKFYN